MIGLLFGICVVNLAQIQVLNVNCFDLSANDRFKKGRGYSYVFMMRENPQDLTDWGYEDT